MYYAIPTPLRPLKEGMWEGQVFRPLSLGRTRNPEGLAKNECWPYIILHVPFYVYIYICVSIYMYTERERRRERERARETERETDRVCL